MDDFAASAMMRLIDAGLARQGLGPPAGSAPATAHVPLAAKRGRAEDLLERFGPTALLRIAEALDDAWEEPTLVALSLARDPADLVGRWQRLERFVHSRHRTRILDQDDRRMVLQHVALAPHPPPRRAEDLLVFGLLAALFRRLGVAGLRLRLPHDSDWRYARGRWREAAWPADLSTWEFAWSSFAAAADAVAPPDPGDDPVAAARGRLAADPGRRWTVRLLADELHASARSLQRRLNAQGTSFTQVLTDTRLSVAARMLTGSAGSVAEIGYRCGFADQAHFTRAFRRHTGITPSRYKAQFAPAD